MQNGLFYSEYFCEDLKYFLIKCLSPEKSSSCGNDSPKFQGSWGNLEFVEVRAETKEMVEHLCKEKQDAHVPTDSGDTLHFLQRQKLDLVQISEPT